MDQRAVNGSLLRLASRKDHPLAESLQAVIDACVQVFDVTGSGLMVADEQSTLRYAVATDGPGRILEDVQLDSGDGPCVEAFVRDTVVVSTDLAADPRWPDVAERVGPL